MQALHCFLVWIQILILLQTCACQINAVQFSLEEESEPQVLGNLNISNGQSYSLSPSSDLFLLDGNTGQLESRQPIDRESLENDRINLLAVSTSDTQAPPIEITVLIQDINDNNPIFSNNALVNLKIPENVEVGSQYFLPTATDLDLPKNGISTKYNIVEGDKTKFKLLVDSSPGDQTLLYLVTEQTFNTEHKDHYELNVSATDDGNPARKGYLSVLIDIFDSNNNNNEPVFDFSQYTVRVFENTTVGSVILTVQATDSDQGANGVVRYRIQDQSTGKRYFDIGTNSGNITLVKQLDYETSNAFHLGLEAYDSGDPVLFGQAFVSVLVERVFENDYDPEISFRFFPHSVSIATVSIGADAGTYVAGITVNDQDSPSSALSLSLTGGNEMNHFELVAIPGFSLWDLKVMRLIDQTVVASYNLTFCAEDTYLAVVRSSCKSLTVLVNSLNNDAPSFSQASYHQTLSEITAVGTFVVEVQATDMDIGLPGLLRYEILHGNDLNWFQIDSKSGVITTIQVLDYEALHKNPVHLVITARDESSNPLFSNTTVYITITDVNDNVPVFERDYYEATVSNQLPVDIMQVTASDPDVGDGGNVRYSIFSVKSMSVCSKNFLPHFSINQNGLMRLLLLPSNTTFPQNYEVVVMAKDDGKFSLSSKTIVCVTVVSSERFLPQFYPIDYFVSLSPGFAIKRTVTTVEATLMGKKNEYMRYSILSTKSSFDIDSVTGQLFITNTSLFSSEVFVVQISANVNGIFALQTATVYVVVEEAASFSFDQTFYQLQIVENALSFSSVIHVSASNVLSSFNVNYRIADGDKNGNFVIDSQSGVVSVSDSAGIDREMQAYYNLTLIATLHDDNTTLLTFALSQLFVIVLDSNDNSPLFSNGRRVNETNFEVYFKDKVVLSLDEHQSYVGSAIYNASAFDCDSGENSRLIYYIEDAFDVLSVNKNGIVSAKQSFPNFKTEHVNTVLITACDLGSPCRCNDLQLTVVIQPWIGEELTTFPVKNYLSVFINENAREGTKLMHFPSVLPQKYASSVVVAKNGSLSVVAEYSIYSGDPEKFFGISSDGVLYLKSFKLDREQNSLFLLTVIITLHNGQQSYGVRCFLTIVIEDENDNNPEFQSSKAYFTFTENKEAHSTIGYDKAYDQDDAIKGSVVYTMDESIASSGSENGFPFAISRTTGRLTTTCKIDFEVLEKIWNEFLQSSNTFAFTVTASDNGGADLSTTLKKNLSIIMSILNKKELPPEFSKSLYLVNVTEGNATPVAVIQLHPANKDVTSNLTYQIQSEILDFPFMINQSSGLVTLSHTLDREMHSMYVFIVTIAEEGSRSFSSTCTVQVDILDVNDNPPIFEASGLQWSVSEGTQLYQTIARISATDPDELGSNSIVNYALASSNSAVVFNTFAVDGPSGDIMLIDNLDREISQVYDVIVSATDSGLLKQSTTATVKIAVTDINDNRPIMTSSKIFSIQEGVYRNSISIGTITASDRDIGDNGRVSFAIVRQLPYTSEVQISVGLLTGQLFLTGVVDREQFTESKLEVTVRLSDNPTDDEISLWTNEVVEIVIEDVNDNSPSFVSPNTVFIPSTAISSIGFEIATVLASDFDLGHNGSVQFTNAVYNNQSQLFKIQPATGILQLFNALPSDHSLLFPVMIIAHDLGSPERYSMTTINVVVGDPQLQNGPIFQSSTYIGTIEENKEEGTAILSVSTTGIEVQYFISASSKTSASKTVPARRPFVIDSHSGMITNLERLDREDIASYTLEVVAVDMTSSMSNPRMTSSQVVISILDLNDNPPVFLESEIERRVSEDVSSDFVVATVTATDADTSSNIVYSLLSTPGSEQFNIRPTTGTVSVGSGGLDREKKSRYILTVVASDGVHEASFNLIVYVDDVNDNNPEFSLTQFVFSIEEGLSTPPSGGRYIGTVQASDKDIESSLTYTFANRGNLRSHGLFTLNSRTGSLYLNSSNNYPVDREHIDLYVFTVRATDSGGRFADVIVYVNIEDINDNAPVFLKLFETMELDENVSIDHAVTVIKAQDTDLGFNSFVEYYIVAGNSFNMFKIGIQDGVISTQNILDFETQSRYELMIMATDLSEDYPRRKSYMNLTIFVKNVNDNTPELTLPLVAFVSENADPGTVVLRIGAFDVDDVSSGISSNFEYTMLLQQPPTLGFTVDSGTGDIKVGSLGLNRALVSSYNLTISVSDKGSPPLSTVGVLNIKIVDVNDNSPVFDDRSIDQVAFIKEDSRLGYTVATIQATDSDAGYNGIIKYRLIEPSNLQRFSIDSNTGVVYLSGFLDHEAKTRHALIVEAFDCGAPCRKTTTNLTVLVMDVNDSPPAIIPASLVLHVNENTIQELFQFGKSDVDSGNGGIVDFIGVDVTSFMKNGVSRDVDRGGIFTLSDSGLLSVEKPLDKEEVDSYTVVITAADRGTPWLTTSASLLVVIEDVNEYEPAFQPTSYEVTVSENISLSDVVVGLRAVDKDDGCFGRIRYVLETQDVPFIVNPSTGKVFASTSLDREAQDFYAFSVVAMGNTGINSSPSVASIAVRISDSNDNPPVFERNLYTFVTNRNENRICGVVFASDADLGLNSKVVYSIIADKDLAKFEINSETGAIRSSERLTGSSYRFQVEARDRGDPQFVAFANVTVTISDASFPLFIDTLYAALEIQENEAPTTVNLITFQANSLSSVRYHLAGGNIGNSFTIDERSGKLTRVKQLDREATSSYNLWIEARTESDQTAFVSLTINVLDKNDNAPVFSKPIYFAHVAENVANHVLVTVSAVDYDTGSSGLFDFSLVASESDSPEKFKVDSQSGVVKNVESLDREKKDMYVLTILARDRGTPSYASKASVYVIVDDVNDLVPMFTRLHSVAVRENSMLGDFVIQIHVSDRDSPAFFSQIRYSLNENFNNTFAIDPVSGVVTVNKKLDREKKSSYTLEVTVDDGSWTPETSIDVEITDINDNPPRFNQSQYEVDVATGIKPGSLLIALSAHDPDQGLNGEIFYEIVSPSGLFSINHISGELFTSQSLVCSTTQDSFVNQCPATYSLTVRAADNGLSQSLSSTVTVIVTIHAPNVHNPVFNSTFLWPVALLQSSEVGTSVFKLSAFDEDNFDEDFHYSIVGGSHAQYFNIDKNTGVISTKSLLSNIALLSLLAVEVRVQDGGFPTRQFETTVLLEITDENSNGPVFQRSSYAAPLVEEDIARYSVISTVVALDSDQGVNGMILYSLSKEDANKPFKINETTGQVYTSFALDYETESSYMLTVIARDRASKPKNSSVLLLVSVADVNDNPPVFNSSLFVVYVPENTTPQTKITRLVATDADSNENALLEYSLVPQSHFVIQSSTGDVFTAQDLQLNYEQRNFYEITVMASNTAENSGARFRTSTTLQVLVTDKNEFAPQVASTSFYIFTSVQSKPGSVIYQLEATDNDAGIAGEIHYILADWSKKSGFDVNQTTGQIFVAETASLVLGSSRNVTIFLKNPGVSDSSKITRVDIGVKITTDKCLQDPCLNGGTCQEQLDEVSCLCPRGFTGTICEYNIDECWSSPCQNNGQCTDLVNGYHCKCTVAYTGLHCELEVDFCEEHQCENGGTCIGLSSTYKCQCPFGFIGTDCEKNSFGFDALSYLRISSMKSDRYDISFEFATVMSSALLFYNHGGDNSTDFVALELIEGVLRLSYRITTINNNRIIRVHTGQHLRDGLWHHVAVTLNDLEALAVINGCDDVNACTARMNHVSQTLQPFSQLLSNSLYVGGVQSLDDILFHPNQVSSFDFVGCLRNLQINSFNIDTISSVNIQSSSGVTDGCNRAGNGNDGNACGSGTTSPICGLGAVCSDQWSFVHCECPSNKSGKACQNERVGSTFDGQSYFLYTFTPSFTQEQSLSASEALSKASSSRKKRVVSNQDSRVSIRFRSRQQDGVILLVQGTIADNFAILQIENGSLVYSYTSSPIVRKKVLSTNISDGAWHEVEILLSENVANSGLEITLNMVSVASDTYAGGITNFIQTSQVQSFHVGGASRAFSSSLNAFRGCVFSFKVNEQSQPLADDGRSLLFNVAQTSSGGSFSPNVAKGCTGSDVCAANPCPGMYCNDIWEAFECIPLGLCATSPCLNGGSCIPHLNGSFVCACANNYTGQTCQTFVPCLSLDCSDEGRVCVPSVGLPVCSCVPGYLEIDGVCRSQALRLQSWWIYVIAVVGILVFFIVAALMIRYFILKRRQKLTSVKATNEVYQVTHSPPKNTTEKSNGQNGSSNGTLEFDKIHENGVITHTIQLSHPDLLSEEVRAADDVTLNDAAGLTVPEIGSTLSLKVTGSTDAAVLPAEEVETDVSTRKDTAQSQPASPLPSYELFMRKRYGLIPNDRLEMEDDDIDIKEESILSIPSYLFRMSDTDPSDTSSSCNPPSTISTSSRERHRYMQSPLASKTMPNKLLMHNKRTSSSVLNNPNLAYLPNGRVSPTKSPAAFRFAQRDAASKLRTKTSSSLTSSSASSSSHDPRLTTPPQNYSLERMVEHVNSYVGLTKQEIEILTEVPLQEHSSSPNDSSNSVSSFPKTLPRNGRLLETERPSSLPGRRIPKLPLHARSRTPMYLPVTSSFRPTTGLPNKIIATSENILHQAFDNSSQEDEAFTTVEDMNNTLRNSDENMHLDFLMSYGKHYEGLAGVFQDLAALPSIKDEEEPESEFESSPAFASSSFILPNIANKDSSASCNDTQTPVSQNRKTNFCSSNSPPTSSRSAASSNSSKQQEHYV